MSTENKDACYCDACRYGLDAVREYAAAVMAEQGWYDHGVFGTKASPTGIERHTHGFPSRFCCPDVQVVIDAPRDMSGALHALAFRLNEGARIGPGVRLGGVMRSAEVTFGWAMDPAGRPVLRMIVPDKAGNLGPEGVGPDYAAQWVGVDKE